MNVKTKLVAALLLTARAIAQIEAALKATVLGVSVDVLTLKDLPAKFRDVVAQEARPV